MTTAREKLQAEGKADYWDYSIDHIAKYDIKAFMHAIFEAKVKDFKIVFADLCKDKTEEKIRKLAR